MYYRTSYTQVFDMNTGASGNSRLWAGKTVNLFTQIADGQSPDFYKDPNACQVATREAFEACFEQKKITGVGIKLIIPQGAGSSYVLTNGSVGNIQPSRVVWAFDENSQIGIEAPPATL